VRHVLLGTLIGCAVLAAAMVLPARGRDAPPGLPPLERHALRDGRAEVALAPRTSSVFAFDERLWPVEPWAPAARDAAESGRWVGAGGGVVSAMLPGPGAGALQVEVAVHDAEPPLRPGDDHVVDLDTLVDEGLVLVGTGSVTGHAVDVPAGAYRLRVAGRGYRTSGAEGLRLDLWPRRTEAPPRLRRAWRGFSAAASAARRRAG
jgi:hypothetical protein